MEKVPQTDHSECNPSSHGEDTHTETLTSITISDQVQQKTKTNELAQINSSVNSGNRGQPIPLPDFSHQEQVKNDSACVTDITIQAEDKSKGPLTNSSPRQSIAHDLGVQTNSSDATDTYDQTLTLSNSSQQEQYLHKDQSTLVPGQNVQSASMGTATFLNIPTNEPHQIMLHHNDKLITVLSADPLGIAGILLAKGLIPENTAAQMQLRSTPHEKATILVTIIRQRVKVAPQRFQEFVGILSEQAWTKDIVEILQPFISTEYHNKESDASVHGPSVCDHKSLNKEPIESLSSSEQSSSSEDGVFPTLNSEDEAELEAQLIMSAECMKKKFAALLWSIIDSFKSQGIDPQSLVAGILALTEYEDPSIGKPLLAHEKDALMKAKTVDQIFHILQPHISFFSYETLEFLIDKKGSKGDKRHMQKFLREFKHFCKRSVFEVPQSLLHHSSEKSIKHQSLHVKITKQFKAALLIDGKETSASISCEKISAPELGISLECAKHIQRKIASVLKVTVSSLYLESVSTGSAILTFLLPSHISLAGVDSDPEVIALSLNGIHFLCGPPGKPERQELIPNGIVMRWSQPEYGYGSLAQYILYYQK